MIRRILSWLISPELRTEAEKLQRAERALANLRNQHEQVSAFTVEVCAAHFGQTAQQAARVTELLHANNREVERRRAAEADRAALKRHNDELRAILEERFADAALLSMGRHPDGGFEMTVRSPIVRVMAANLAEQLKEFGGENYTQTEVNHEELGPLVMTIQRRLGKTPAQVNSELKAEVSALRAALIACGRHVGAVLSDRVSSEFLVLVPEEVRLVVAKLKAEVSTRPAAAETTAPRWRHKVRGSTYVEVARAPLQCSTRAPVEGDMIVLYRGTTGEPLARAAFEFEDGRFDRIDDGAAS